MGHAYQAVGWNPQKKAYDRALLGAVLLWIAAFVGVGFGLHPDATVETLLIRACGTGALVLLHVILCIGPLCRLDRRWLPLLYNRRHMGVTMFVLALLHGGLSILQFHAFGELNPLVSVFVSSSRYGDLTAFPFQPLGFAALVILFLMAATSHDFWLANLTAPVWKALHMLVYLAYVLVVLHVALGALQAATSPVWSGFLSLGVLLVSGLHLAAGRAERAGDAELPVGDGGWVDAGPVSTIPEDRARIVTVAGDRVAVFRYDGKVSALSNACQHQNGPLGEGRIIDGCVTCPWHGYQYLPDRGSSPPPFTERVPTFRVRIEAGHVLVHEVPLPAGTPVEPAIIPSSEVSS